MSSPSRLPGLTITLILIAGPALAQQLPLATDTGATRVDRFGDALPAGAIARLGTLRLRPDGIAYTLEFSPDSRTVATVGKKGRIQIWEVATGRLVGMMDDGKRRSISGLAWSSDGKTLASCGDIGPIVRLWNVATEKEVRQWTLPRRGSVYRVAFSRDGKQLAVGWHGGGAHLLDPSSGQVTHELAAHSKTVEYLAFSPDGERLVTGCTREPPCCWDTVTGKRIRCFNKPAHRFQSLSADGKTVAVVGEKDACHIFEVDTGNKLREFGKPSFCVGAISPDHTIIALDRGTDRVSLVELATGRQLQELVKTPENGNFSYGSSLIRFSPSGSIVSLRSSYGMILLWETDTGKPLPRLNLQPEFDVPRSRVESIAVAPDGERIAVRYRDELNVRVWETTTGKQRLTIPAKREITFAPNGKVIAAAGRSEIVLHDADSGKSIRKLNLGDDIVCTSLTYNGDGRILAAGATGGRIFLWDTATGHLVRQFEVHPVEIVKGRRQRRDDVSSVSFFPGGREIVFGSYHRSQPGICDAVTGTVLRRLPLPPGYMSLYDIAISPDGKAVASTKRDGSRTLDIWEVATGQLRQQIKANTSRFLSLAFSPKGHILATGGSDELGFDAVIQFWDPFTGEEVSRLDGHQGSIKTVAFLPHDRFASGSADSTVLVWQGPFGEPAGPVPGSLTEKDLEAHWKLLAEGTAVEAFGAMKKLASSPALSLPFLHDRLNPTRAPDREQLNRLVANLSSDQFPIRSRATAELEELGESVAPVLQKLLAGEPGLEVKRRAAAILAKVSRRQLSRNVLRTWRTIEILEWVGTTAAKETLGKLARGAPGIVTTDARRALKRLAGNSPAG